MSGRIAGLIPARGGSKGLPGKNIKLLGGRPLIDYVIKSALESNIDEVWVSTDCDAIQETSLESGAQVIRRPDSLSLDESPVDEAIVHFAECVPNFETIVMLQCTSPLTLPEDIDNAIKKYQYHTQYDTLISVCAASSGFQCGGYHWQESPNDNLFRTSNYYPCRQDAPTKYKENGAIYVLNRSLVLETKSKISGRVGTYFMPRHRSFEIDYLDEFEELELLLECGFIDAMNEKGPSS